MSGRRLKVVLCWAGYAGYLAACWRALARRPEIDLTVVAFGPSAAAPFDPALLEGLSCRVLPPEQRDDPARVAAVVAELTPDVVSISGWFIPAYTRLPFDRRLASARFVMAVDTPWRGTLRQRLARWKLWRLLDRIDRVIVAGERSWQYARRLGVSEARIQRGVYGIDYDAFRPLHAQRAAQPGGWPRRFLFTGRYAPEKGIDVLVDAYRRYRATVRDPWPLTCCGAGPLAHLLRGMDGIEDRGFVQPPDQPAVSLASGAFVLASRFDPWPLVVLEACAAGLPVICTEACGSAVELVRPHHSGLTVATGDAAALARGLAWAHARHAELAEMGRRAQPFAAAYAAEVWADRWTAACRELCGMNDDDAAAEAAAQAGAS